MQLAKLGIDAIISYEIGAEFVGDTRYYNSRLTKPTYPGGNSGVTIGIGYDLGYNTIAQIRKDWEGKVNGNLLAFFISCSGLKGKDAARKIKQETSIFKIPYEVAYNVFINSTLPRFCKEAKETFPSIEKLNPLAQAVIVSVVFNRGNGLVDTSTNAQKEGRRKEMRNLLKAIDKVDYNSIAKEIEAMKRLWDGVPDFDGDVEVKMQGLIDRRIAEAKLIIQSTNMQFTNEDIVAIAV